MALAYVMAPEKTGSQTAYQTARAAFRDLKVYHCHGMSYRKIGDFEIESQKQPRLRERMLRVLMQRNAFEQANRPTPVITLCREPVARFYSAFHHKYQQELRDRFDGKGFADAETLIASFVEFVRTRLPRYAEWYDTEIRNVLGVDLLSSPSPAEHGYITGRSDLASLVLIRLEDFNRVYAQAIRSIGGTPPPAPVVTNVADGAPAYSAFRKLCHIPDDLVGELSSIPWVRHFYPDRVPNTSSRPAGRAAGPCH